MFGPINNQKGLALIIALMLTLMLAIIGLGIVQSTSDEVNIAGNELDYPATIGTDTFFRCGTAPSC